MQGSPLINKQSKKEHVLSEEDDFEIGSPAFSSRFGLINPLPTQKITTTTQQFSNQTEQIDGSNICAREPSSCIGSLSTVAAIKEANSEIAKKIQNNQQFTPQLFLSHPYQNQHNKIVQQHVIPSMKKNGSTILKQIKRFDLNKGEEKQFWKEISENLSQGSAIGEFKKANDSFEDASSKAGKISKNLTKHRGHTLNGSSTKQASSMTKVSLKNVRKNILNLRKTIFFRSLKIFSAIAFLIVFSMSIFVYLDMLNQIDVVFQTLQFIPWPLSFRSNYQLSSNYQAMLNIIRRRVFPENSRLDSTFTSVLNNRAKTGIQQMKDLQLQYVNGDKQIQQFFYDVTAVKVNFIATKDLASIPVGLQLSGLPSTKQKIWMTLSYFLQTCIGYIYRYSTVTSNLNEQIVRLDNASNLSSNITQIDNKIADQSNDVLSTMKLESLVLMIADICITIILITSIFPIYNFVQTNNEKILKLFATLQPQIIDEMLKPINNILQRAFKMQKITSCQKNYELSRAYRRKKNHCQTNELQKYKKSFVFLSITFLVTLITLPVFNYLEIVSISSEISSNIDLARTIIGQQPRFFNVLALVFHYLIKRLDSSYQLYAALVIKAAIPQLIQDHESYLSTLLAAVDQSQSNTNRFKQEEYKQFFYKMFQDNLCESLQNNSQFLSETDQFQFDYCQGIRHGKLQEGLKIALKDCQLEFTYLSELLNIINQSSFVVQARQWQKRVDLKDFDDFYTTIMMSVRAIGRFLVKMMSDQLTQNQKMQTILFIAQTAILLLIFYFGWVQFYTHISSDMENTQMLLSIIDIEIILENPYIINMLNQSQL